MHGEPGCSSYLGHRGRCPVTRRQCDPDGRGGRAQGPVHLQPLWMDVSPLHGSEMPLGQSTTDMSPLLTKIPNRGARAARVDWLGCVTACSPIPPDGLGGLRLRLPREAKATPRLAMPDRAFVCLAAGHLARPGGLGDPNLGSPSERPPLFLCGGRSFVTARPDEVNHQNRLIYLTFDGRLPT